MDERIEKLNSDLEEFKREVMASPEYMPMMRALVEERLGYEEPPVDPIKMKVIHKDKYAIKYLREYANFYSQEIVKLNQEIDAYYQNSVTNSESKDWWYWLIDKAKENRKDLIKRLTICERKAEVASGKAVKESGYLDISRAKLVPMSEIIGDTGEGNKDRRKFCCPIHHEKTPSFVWYVKENRAKCFGCSWFGDSIDLYMKINNVDFTTAVKTLNKY